MVKAQKIKPASAFRHFCLTAALFASLLLPAGGCASRVRDINTASDTAAPPELAVFEPTLIRIGILGAQISMYDVSAGGIFEYRADWSRSASNLAARSAALMMKRMEYIPFVLPSVNRPRELLHLETKLRYHSAAFQSDFFAEKARAFGEDAGEFMYSTGPIDSLCDRYGVDGFLYIYGFEEKLSSERRQLLSEKGRVPPERTFAAIILAQRDGRIVWYKRMIVHDNLDMRTEEHSLQMIGALFE